MSVTSKTEYRVEGLQGDYWMGINRFGEERFARFLLTIRRKRREQGKHDPYSKYRIVKIETTESIIEDD